MFSDNRILAIIPARAGSKGIKNKNVIDLCGRPLIDYSISAAKKSKYIDNVVVSTDGVKIAEIAKTLGARVPFLRPAELATDKSKTIDSIIFTIEELLKMGESYDVLVLLQPTQPLRTAEDIDNAIEIFFNEKMQSLVSVSPVDDHPILIRTIDENGRLKTLLPMNSTCRRQDMPSFYKVNGAIYINRVSELNFNTSFNDNVVPFVMDRSHSVDIDEKIDLQIAKMLIKEVCHD